MSDFASKTNDFGGAQVDRTCTPTRNEAANISDSGSLTATSSDGGIRELTDRGQRQRQLAAVKHGLFVRAEAGVQLRSRRERRLAARVRAALPWLRASDDAAVRAWSRFELVAARMLPQVLDANVLTEEGRNLTDLWRRVMLAKRQYEQDLGMTPVARAGLGVTVERGTALAQYLSDKYANAGESSRVVAARGLQTDPDTEQAGNTGRSRVPIAVDADPEPDEQQQESDECPS